MPKRKPDSVVVHRVELSDTERKLLKNHMDLKNLETGGKALAFASIPVGMVGLFYLGVKIGDATLPMATKMENQLSEKWDKFFLNPKNMDYSLSESRIIDSIKNLFSPNN